MCPQNTVCENTGGTYLCVCCQGYKREPDTDKFTRCTGTSFSDSLRLSQGCLEMSLTHHGQTEKKRFLEIRLRLRFLELNGVFIKKRSITSTADAHWPYHAGFPATLEIRENLENEFPIFRSGKAQGVWGKRQKSGENQGICDSDPEGKAFRQFGVCAS